MTFKIFEICQFKELEALSDGSVRFQMQQTVFAQKRVKVSQLQMDKWFL